MAGIATPREGPTRGNAWGRGPTPRVRALGELNLTRPSASNILSDTRIDRPRRGAYDIGMTATLDCGLTAPGKIYCQFYANPSRLRSAWANRRSGLRSPAPAAFRMHSAKRARILCVSRSGGAPYTLRQRPTSQVQQIRSYELCWSQASSAPCLRETGILRWEICWEMCGQELS
jgi:hypothetical protein